MVLIIILNLKSCDHHFLNNSRVLHNLGVNKDFSGHSKKALTIKEKNNILFSIKIKNLCSPKRTLKKIKLTGKLHTRKMFTIHVSDKGLVVQNV